MKNGIKYLVAGLVATGLTVSSYATITATLNAASNSYVTDNTGAANYLTGDLVEIGAFSVAPTVGSPSLANFTVFATGLTSSGGFSVSKTLNPAGAFSHTQVYLVVFNQANANIIGTTQLAIADVNDASNTSWRFPADADVPSSTLIELDSLFNGTTGNLATGAQILFGGHAQDPSGPYNMLETGLIPEPSTWVLVGTGLVGLLGLRRRRS